MDNNKDFDKVEVRADFDILDIDESYKNQNFQKKKRGIAGFFQRISTRMKEWWGDLSKAKKVWFSIGVSFLVIALSVIIAIASILIPLLNYNYREITSDPKKLGVEKIIDEKVINIALFGIDTRSTKSFSGNSDSIMVLSVDTKAKKIKIVSIMRDSLVKIEHKGKTYYQKINSAYAMGGPELAIKTINQNFGLDIMEYATVNFYGMAEMIDAVGGIEAELTYQEVSTGSKDGFNGLVRRHCEKIGVKPDKYYIRKAGKHKLNGIQAVAYSRIRKFVNVWGTNNDFGRTDRQRYVMEQLFNKAVKMPKSKYLDLINALIPYTETSLSPEEIYDLAVNVLIHSPTFAQSRMPLTEYQMKAPNIPRVGSTVYYDLDFAKKVLYAFFYKNITPEEYVEKNGIDKNDWYGKLMGTTSSSKPTETTSSNTSPTTSSKPSTSSGNTNSSSQTTPSTDQSVPDSGQDTVPDSSSSDITGSSSSEEGTGSGSEITPPGGETPPEVVPSEPQEGTSSEDSTTN